MWGIFISGVAASLLAPFSVLKNGDAFSHTIAKEGGYTIVTFTDMIDILIMADGKLYHDPVPDEVLVTIFTEGQLTHSSHRDEGKGIMVYPGSEIIVAIHLQNSRKMINIKTKLREKLSWTKHDLLMLLKDNSAYEGAVIQTVIGEGKNAVSNFCCGTGYPCRNRPFLHCLVAVAIIGFILFVIWLNLPSIHADPTAACYHFCGNFRENGSWFCDSIPSVDIPGGNVSEYVAECMEKINASLAGQILGEYNCKSDVMRCSQ